MHSLPFLPFLPADFVERTVDNVTSFDAGRGCPFQCSFCTIVNVQGCKSRYRSPDSAIYDRIIKLREEDSMDVRFMIQVNTLCPQDSEPHREIPARRRHPRAHRSREHQPGEPNRSQEAAEQDHRVSQDAARIFTRCNGVSSA
jgi:hypothetical protein